MEQLQYENYGEFVSGIADRFNALEDEFNDISVVAKCNEAKEIIKGLLCIGYDIASVELYNEELDNYWDEYLITLNFDGVWCEKFKKRNGYINNESSISYIMDNCCSKVIKHCTSPFLYEVSVGESDDMDGSDDINDNIHGFTLSSTDGNGYRSLSYYTTNALTEKNIQDMVEKFGHTLV